MSAHRVCPWWLGYFLANPLRKLLQDPDKILRPLVIEGMSVLEIGPGMGFFTVPMARRVGPTGRVVCVDIQEKMLQGLSRRAAKSGLADRIQTRVIGDRSLQISDLAGSIDFALLFAVVHEVPDPEQLWKELADAMKEGGTVLFSEPSGHVNDHDFAVSLAQAHRVGFQVIDRPAYWKSRSALLRRG